MIKLEALFSAIYVDAIEEPNRLGKQALFERILKEHNLTSGEALIVGDNADSEIAAGNQLSIQTVQILRPGVPRANNAKFHVQSLLELKNLLKSLNGWGLTDWPGQSRRLWF